MYTNFNFECHIESFFEKYHFFGPERRNYFPKNFLTFFLLHIQGTMAQTKILLLSILAPKK